MKRILFTHVVGLLTLVGLLAVDPAQAQTPYTLEAAVDYAIKNNLNIKNTQLDSKSAESRIGEIRAAGLPQVSATAGLIDNLIIQTAFLPAFIGGGSPDDPPVAVQFGVKYQSNVSATLNQLIFSGSYIVGLRAAATYRELAKKNVTQSKVTVAEAVTKAYYSAQVAVERAKVLDLNIERLDTLMRDTRATFEAGFVEKIDVDRLEVQLNNLKTERQNVQNLIELSYTLLKFQMGMPLTDQIVLTDIVDESDANSLPAPISNAVDYSKRIEYSLLNTQGELAELDIKRIRSGYLPTASAFASYGYNSGRNNFGEIFSQKWFNNSAIGLNIQIPIFDGLTKKYQLQQAQITSDKVKVGRDLLTQSIDLQVQQANITLTNSLQTLETQQRNVDLAEEVVRVSKIKYQEGVGSNIEVINAESSLKEAQTNYFAALYDVLIAKVDLSKARGELYEE
ncbi:TolC family protein [Persicitalea jodogahamensis]|uniref:Transporter n=1 Tax=Persicitalea jodogahamensis TaxID=402147 RepID=A0A8J3DCK1_9BACT|nr:TolC family protein [Persicitalea jodogahamensis]GHB82887.1 transporter [Persicitalea jodogahamensis]